MFETIKEITENFLMCFFLILLPVMAIAGVLEGILIIKIISAIIVILYAIGYVFIVRNTDELLPYLSLICILIGVFLHFTPRI